MSRQRAADPLAICDAYEAGQRVKEIAWDFGISANRVSAIARQYALPMRIRDEGRERMRQGQLRRWRRAKAEG